MQPPIGPALRLPLEFSGSSFPSFAHFRAVWRSWSRRHAVFMLGTPPPPDLHLKTRGISFVEYGAAGPWIDAPGFCSSTGARSQDAGTGDTESSEAAPKRILGIVPNYRTSPSLRTYKPLIPREKFKMASQDSFDRGAFVLGALFGGEAQLTKATPSFGQGLQGYAKYFATSYAGFAIGNFMTEAIYPTLLHQDPRYFRRGDRSVISRLGYAMSQIFWTHKDSGGMQFNFSEIVGNSTAVAISNAYLPDNRNASDAAKGLGVQIGVDMAGNILKEFSPELAQAFSRKHPAKDEAKQPVQ
jgi:hypothetical protein